VNIFQNVTVAHCSCSHIISDVNTERKLYQTTERIYLDVNEPRSVFVCVLQNKSRHTGQSWWQALGGQPALDSGSSSPLGPHFNSEHFTGQWAHTHTHYCFTILVMALDWIPSILSQL